MKDRPPDPAFAAAMQEALELWESGAFEADSFRQRHPAHADAIVEKLGLVERLADPGAPDVPWTPPSTAPSARPERLGDFDLGEELGRGGMGVVYAARQARLDRDAAVKILPPGFAGTPTLRERFEREAALAARLTHPSIVRVYAFGEENGTAYLAMERIHGASLQKVLDRLKSIGDPEAKTGERLFEAIGGAHPPPHGFRGYVDAIVDLGIAVADALHAAHGQGLVHRDVKPGNILLDPTGAPHLADFGLARAREVESLTASGHLLGTPAFLSPECVRGERADPRSDVFSLGVSLYEALALELPFRAETQAAVIHRVLVHDPPSLDRVDPRIPADLANVIQKALEKEPDRRYPSAAAFRDDLDRFRRGDLVLASRVGPVGRLLRRARRRPAVAAAIGGLTFLLLAVSVGATIVLLGKADETRAQIERLLERGRGYERDRKLQAAADAFREVLVLDRDHEEAAAAVERIAPDLRRLRAQRLHDTLFSDLYWPSRDVSGGPTMDDLSRWVEESGKAREGWLLKTLLAMRQRKDEQALAFLDRTAAMDDGAAVHILRGLVRQRLGQGDRAEAERKRGLAMAPRHMEDYLYQSSHAFEDGRIEESIDLIRRAAQKWPRSPIVLIHHGYLLNQLEAYSASNEVFEKALLLKPDSVRGRIMRAYTLLQLRRLEEARTAFEAGLALRPGNPHAIGGLAETLARLGGRENRARAFTLLDEALAGTPHDAGLLTYRGWLHFLSGKVREAERDYRAALEVDPDHLANVNLIFLLTRSSRREQALEHLEACLERSSFPRHLKADLYNQRAILHWNEPARAAADFRRGLAVFRKPLLVGNLALLCINNNRFAAAEPLLSEQLALGYEVEVARARRGVCRLMRLDVERAVADLELARQGFEENPRQRTPDWVHEMRATAFTIRSDRDAAHRCLAACSRDRFSPDRARWYLSQKNFEAVDAELEKPLRKNSTPIESLARKVLEAWKAAHQGRFEEAARRLPDPPKKLRLWPDPTVWVAIDWGSDPGRPEAYRRAASAILTGTASPPMITSLPDSGRREDRHVRDWLIGHLWLERGEPATALEWLTAAGENLAWGWVQLELGIALALEKRPEEAVAAFERASARFIVRPLLIECAGRAGVRPGLPALDAWLGGDPKGL